VQNSTQQSAVITLVHSQCTNSVQVILWRSEIMHVLCCSPCTMHPSLEKIESIFRKGLCAIANLYLTDPQWFQTSLPVKEGGLGVFHVTSQAPFAFLASAASIETLQQQLLLRCGRLGSFTPQQPPSSTSGFHSTACQVHQVPPHTVSMGQGGSGLRA